MKTKLLAAALLLLATSPVHAKTIDGGLVDAREMSSVWRQVITGEDGLVVKTTLTGKMAEKAMSMSGSSGPVTVNVSRVVKYQQPGCARIRMAYHLPNASLKDGGKHDADFNYEQNLCADGTIPKNVTVQN